MTNIIDPMQYDLSDDPSSNSVRCLIDEFDEILKNVSGKCMDVGCGPGNITKNILLPALDPNAVMIGTDISEHMVKYANKKYGDKSRIQFEVLDIETKNLPTKYVSEYDYVFSFFALPWCSDIRQAFENMYRLLQPGGSILIITVVYNDMYDILHKLSQDARYSSYVTDVRNFLPPFYDSAKPVKDIKALLRSIGFNVLHCSERDAAFSDEEAQKIPPLILSLATQYWKNMPDDLMEQLKNEFTQEYAKGCFYKRMRNARIASDISERIIIHAQKDDDVSAHNTINN